MKTIMPLLPVLTFLLCPLGHSMSTENAVISDGNQTIVRYEEFGAKGDGKTDDLEAIVKAHAHANAQELPVKADDGATYYIGGKNKTAVIQTNTDFGKAKFIVDDRSVENRKASIFSVTSPLKPIKIPNLTSLKKKQKSLNVSLPARCFIKVVNDKIKRYIRYGSNQNNGASQTDVFLVDAAGNVDMNAPIIWDFETITKITALPVDKERLTIRGGRFTTIANDAESKYTYHSRNLSIRRSNVEVVGLEHTIKGEGAQGAPYQGFISVSDCADVTVRDTVLTGHKVYRTIGSAGRPVSMGSYDISVHRAISVSFINCSQTNDINNRKYWGIMGSNYCKNLVYDGCTLSRFDAHMGVCNATIRNSTLGYMGINAIGHGTLTVENTTVQSGSFINMRSDYGSTWDGTFVIRNCVFKPGTIGRGNATLIGGRNAGQHDFGYTCHMPERITVDGLRIEDSKHPESYQGPTIFANFNSNFGKPGRTEPYPIVRTKEVILKNITIASGKPLKVSGSHAMFKDVKLVRE